MKHSLRPSPTALLDPKYDSSFKAMFTQDTKESKAALTDFISTILNRKIKDLQLVQNEPPVEIINQNKMSFDVSVKFEDGERADIEMQSRQENYDYSARAEIQAARLLSTNNKSGDNWHTPAVYQISVLDFVFDKDDISPLSWYTMRKDNGGRLSDRTNIIFLELTKIHDLLGKPAKELSKLEKWGLFLSYAGDERYTGYIDEIISSEGGLMNAKSSLCTVSKDEILWAQQNSIDKARRDYNTIVFNANEQGYKNGHEKGLKEGREEGLKQGIQQGIQQGMQQGMQQGIQQVAQNMISAGMPIAQITQLTGLSEAEIQNL